MDRSHDPAEHHQSLNVTYLMDIFMGGKKQIMAAPYT